MTTQEISDKIVLMQELVKVNNEIDLMTKSKGPVVEFITGANTSVTIEDQDAIEGLRKFYLTVLDRKRKGLETQVNNMFTPVNYPIA